MRQTVSDPPRGSDPARWARFEAELVDSLADKFVIANRKRFMREIKNLIRARDFAGAASLVDEYQAKFFVRMALSGEFPLSAVLRAAVERFQPDLLKRFVTDVGVALKRAIKRPILDRVDKAIVLLWDGFDILPLSRKEAGADLTRIPPLKRWNGRAARDCVAFYLCQPGLSYTTYRQRVCLLGKHVEPPVLVINARHDVNRRKLVITYSQEGDKWRSRAVTQSAQNSSLARITKMRINGVCETPRSSLARSRK